VRTHPSPPPLRTNRTRISPRSVRSGRGCFPAPRPGAIPPGAVSARDLLAEPPAGVGGAPCGKDTPPMSTRPPSARISSAGAPSAAGAAAPAGPRAVGGSPARAAQSARSCASCARTAAGRKAESSARCIAGSVSSGKLHRWARFRTTRGRRSRDRPARQAATESAIRRTHPAPGRGARGAGRERDAACPISTG
jgi:hypothetical protein